jgi:catechol 2,3-dioxygenase-like lactoylglutathione lyase family enzyme
MDVKTLDHVALWTAERDDLARLLAECCGMHEIERTEQFTLVGGDARRGKVTLFDADGPRERGVLERLVIRVRDPEETRARLAERVGMDAGNGIVAALPSGLALGVVPGDDDVTDLDRVILRVRDPRATGSVLEELGLERSGDRLHVEDKEVVLRDGGVEEGKRPLLNHIAFLVDHVADVEDEARRRGVEIADVVDAPNTRAVFLWGPDRIKLEYVEHKPGFALV